LNGGGVIRGIVAYRPKVANAHLFAKPNSNRARKRCTIRLYRLSRRRRSLRGIGFRSCRLSRRCGRVCIGLCCYSGGLRGFRRSQRGIRIRQGYGGSTRCNSIVKIGCV
jgi:hypothetical protein